MGPWRLRRFRASPLSVNGDPLRDGGLLAPSTSDAPDGTRRKSDEGGLGGAVVGPPGGSSRCQVALLCSASSNSRNASLARSVACNFAISALRPGALPMAIFHIWRTAISCATYSCDRDQAVHARFASHAHRVSGRGGAGAEERRSGRGGAAERARWSGGAGTSERARLASAERAPSTARRRGRRGGGAARRGRARGRRHEIASTCGTRRRAGWGRWRGGERGAAVGVREG